MNNKYNLTGVSHAEKLFDKIKIPEPNILKNNGSALTRKQATVKVDFLKPNSDRKIARIKRVAATEDTNRTKRHKADDSKINELKQQIKDLADLIPSKITQESVENIKTFILKCKGYLEKNAFKVPDFIFKSKAPAQQQAIKSIPTNIKHNEQKPQKNVTKGSAEQKFSYAAAAKKGTKPQQKPRGKKQIALTPEQVSKIVDGVAAVESAKYKLVYFDGLKRSKITWVKQLLYQSQVRPYFFGNINWVEESKLEVCVNEKMAPQIISHMESIKGITVDLAYSPLMVQSDENKINIFKERFKWQASDKNRNIPSRRIASIVNKLKPGYLSSFKEMFLHVYCDQDNEPTNHKFPPAISEPDSDGMEL
ncbi:hypothetical protein AYI70_g11272 [Smittium culicis]|uniref:Uncharacterized protein n=1 Tax=Smittium culicis TaxID=133412 RepID=A0A1R1X2J9_9FUNG|nr:hypothetical protein AYI70_g11272 [Smittium culicis]